MIRFKRRDGWTRELVASCINGGIEHVIPYYSNETWINDYIRDKMDGVVLPNNLSYGDCSFFYVMDESIVKKTSVNVVLRACIPAQHPLLSANRNLWRNCCESKNMKVGVEVVIKKCAEGTASDFIGRVGEITSSDEAFVCWVNIDGETFPCNPYEIRLANKGDVK